MEEQFVGMLVYFSLVNRVEAQKWVLLSFSGHLRVENHWSRLFSDQTLWGLTSFMREPLIVITSNFPPGSMSDAMAGDDQAEQNPMIIDPIETANAAKTCSKTFFLSK
jgi:hypothetical protein